MNFERFPRLSRLMEARPATEFGHWSLPGLVDAQPTVIITGEREDRMDEFLASGGLRRTIEERQQERAKNKKK